MDDKKSLIEEIRKAADRTRNYGWIHYICAYIVASFAIAGSIAATILAALQVTPGWLTAIVAAIPAAVVAVNTTFNFERKAIWHWRTTKRFETLIRKLRYENAEEAKVSEEFSEIDVETFDGWIVYSALSKESEATDVRATERQAELKLSQA